MYHNDFKITFLVALACIAMLVTSGCTSTGFQSTIKQQSLESQELSGYKLNIVSVKGQRSLVRGSPYAAKIPNEWQYSYMEIAMERYPSLFSKDPEAFPVTVTLYDEKSSTSFFVLHLLTSLLSLGTLPNYPGEVTTPINAEIVFSDRDFHVICANSVRFERTNRWWISVFTPLGLIPVPVHSDLPRVSGVMSFSINDSSDKLTMISTIDAVVQGAQICGVQAFKKRKK